MKKLYNLIKNIFSKLKTTPYIKENPKEFFDKGCWGDTFQINKTDNYRYIKGHGFLSNLFQPFAERGDLFIVDMKSGKKAIYVFTKVKVCNYPNDMFFFSATFLKYKED